MIVISCQHSECKRNGKNREGKQQYKCLECGKRFLAHEDKPLGEMHVPQDKAVIVLKMLLEGMSIRAVERLTGVSKNTILDLLVLVGKRAQQFWKDRIKNIQCERLEVDEVWAFIQCKVRVAKDKLKPDSFGDAYCFTAVDPTTKLLVNFHVGKRSEYDTHRFISLLANTVVGRCQLTTDGWPPYRVAVPRYFGSRVDFATIIKIVERAKDDRRYSPGRVSKVIRSPEYGNPSEDRISTSMVERSNLTWRMRCRRMTRLTNAHSKLWENHEAALALTFVAYNFVTIHSSLKTTPAVKHGLTDHPWTMNELLAELAKHD